jgi:BRCT domain type II-containing protein
MKLNEMRKKFGRRKSPPEPAVQPELPRPRDIRVIWTRHGHEWRSGTIAGKTFAFTGKLDGMTRGEAVRKIRKAGGSTVKHPNSETDFLVVGSKGATAPGNDKTAKQLAAEDLFAAGVPIVVVDERAFFDMLKQTELAL